MWTVSSPTRDVSAHAERASPSCASIESYSVCIFLDWFSTFLKVKGLAEWGCLRVCVWVWRKTRENSLKWTLPQSCRFTFLCQWHPKALSFQHTNTCVCTKGERMEWWKQGHGGRWRLSSALLTLAGEGFHHLGKNKCLRLANAGEEISLLVSAEKLHRYRYLKM